MPHIRGRAASPARDLIVKHLDAVTADSYDVVFLTVGANDALGLRSRSSFSRDVRYLADALSKASPDALILVSLMPRFDRFRSLGNPVRWNLAHCYSGSVCRGEAAHLIDDDPVFLR